MVALGPLLEQVTDTRRPQAAREPVRHGDRPEALLLRQLGAVRRDRSRVPAHRAAVPEQRLQLRDPGARAVLVAAGDRRRPTRRPSTANGSSISIARRDQLCAALSNRLGKPDLCAPGGADPVDRAVGDLEDRDQRRRRRLQPRQRGPGHAASIPTLFYRGAARCCARTSPPSSSTRRRAPSTAAPTVPAAIADMVERVIGYPPSDPHHAGAVQILQDHYNAPRRRQGHARPTRCARRSRSPASRPRPCRSVFEREEPDDDAQSTRDAAGRAVRRRVHRPARAGDRAAGLVPRSTRAVRRAQDMQCAIDARDKMQYLIMSTSSTGDPINCNCPGTYEATDIIHPLQAEVAATAISSAGAATARRCPGPAPTSAERSTRRRWRAPASSTTRRARRCTATSPR